MLFLMFAILLFVMSLIFEILFVTSQISLQNILVCSLNISTHNSIPVILGAHRRSHNLCSFEAVYTNCELYKLLILTTDSISLDACSH
jgi:hypothetical protein